jgi:hypothetical protein
MSLRLVAATGDYLCEDVGDVVSSGDLGQL